VTHGAVARMSNGRRPIVLCGSLGDGHVRALRDRLRAAQREPLVLDPQRFPGAMRINLGEQPDDISIDGVRVPRPAAVYIRSLYDSPAGYGVDADRDMEADWRHTLIKFRERSTLLSAMLYRWETAGVPAYNPLSFRHNITKPFQMTLLSSAGLPVPRTLWSNDPDEVRRFAERGPVVYKPVAGGANTQMLLESDLTPERLNKLSAAPVTFQELLPGDDFRVYVIDGRVVVALRIITKALDFRQNEEAIEPVFLPDAVNAQCIAAAKLLGLRYTGMDLKGDAHGTLRFLELNPSAMFLGFDRMSGTDVGGELVRALMSHG
jgi:glutathione synthase/RimK-type ligase-like ATP-grasp enzyme